MTTREDAGLQTAFRDVMAAVCTPVSVVTATVDGRPHGTTVSAFASLSMHPPMVLVSLDRTSELLAVVRSSGAFGLNVLGRDQSGLARVFAGKGGAEKFAGVPWELDSGSRGFPVPAAFSRVASPGSWKGATTSCSWATSWWRTRRRGSR
jgi:flavin reductase (DIM6/NTAB) family NADH-FMN oxidoreductase RutF